MTYRPVLADSAVMLLVRIIDATEIPLSPELQHYYEVLKKRAYETEYAQWLQTMEQLKPKRSSDESGEADPA